MATEKSNQFHLIMAFILFSIMIRVAIPPFFNAIPNFSPIDAIALFSGAYFNKRFTALMTTFLSVWAGDLFINKMLFGHWVLFYPGFYWQYACYFIMTLLGIRLVNKIKVSSLITTSITCSILFFIVSNFGVWLNGTLYPFSINGLAACYIAAIPFFKTTVISDLLFSFILFGTFELLTIKPNHLMQARYRHY